MLNLGPQSRQWLSDLGVHTLQDLQTHDAVQLYWAVKLRQPKASVNLLYALVGAQQGVHWQQVMQTQKGELLMRLEALREMLDQIGNAAPDDDPTTP